MPYTGKEGEKGERPKPKCPLCKKELSFVMTDPTTGLGGYTCEICDGLGKTHKRIGGRY